MKQKQICLLSFVLLCLSGCLYSQSWSGIIDPSRAINWSNAGTTIPTNRTQCGSTIAAYSGSASAINTALANCGSNQYVQLGAGTFNLSSGIDFAGKSNITLRGMGANQTLLVFTGAASCYGLASDICVESGDESLVGGNSGLNPSNTATWTASSYAKGQTQITLSNVSNLHVGSPLILDQCDDGLSGATCTGTENRSSPTVVVCSADGVCSDDGTGPTGAQRPGRDQLQIVTVAGISGNTVTFSPGLYMPNWSPSKSPGAFWASQPVFADGIESLSNDGTSAGNQSNLVFFNCSGCWVKGVRSIKPTRSHVWVVMSPHTEIRDSYFFGAQSLHSEGYGIEMYSSSDTLVENNIFQEMPSPQMLNGACAGCVISYNFSINDANDANFLFNSLTLHSAGDNFTLAEGNVGNSYRADLFHGSHNFNTVFRNYYNGWETGISGGLTAMYLDPYSRYFNLIGNVLGQPGVTTTYQSTPSGGNWPSAYTIGTGTVNIATSGDAMTVNSLMRWGNYDTATNSVHWSASEVPSGISQYANAVPTSQSLPASFYLNSKPSWWPSGKPWPAIGPDVTGGNIPGVGGHAYTIPAEDCYTNVMKGPAAGTGGALSFNASACYQQQSAPDPPTNLTATPQ